jgi:F420-dependent oxidoreductase-like protein
VDDAIEFAQQAEKDGFDTLWYSHLMLGDPLVPIAVAGRATREIELGTAVLQTYPCHPLLQANRASSVVAAMRRPGLTLGIGASHEHIVKDVYGLDYSKPGRSTEEYLKILTALFHGETVDFEGADWTAHSESRFVQPQHQIPVLLAALSPRMLRIAGQYADGTILWMAPPTAIERNIVPRIAAASAAAGRAAPRIVAGLPVAVHTDIDEARDAATASSRAFNTIPNYRRILDAGGVPDAADAAIVGSPQVVRKGISAVFEAGATDLWAGIFPAGSDADGSVRRTYEVLAELAQ